MKMKMKKVEKSPDYNLDRDLTIAYSAVGKGGDSAAEWLQKNAGSYHLPVKESYALDGVAEINIAELVNDVNSFFALVEVATATSTAVEVNPGWVDYLRIGSGGVTHCTEIETLRDTAVERLNNLIRDIEKSRLTTVNISIIEAIYLT